MSAPLQPEVGPLTFLASIAPLQSAIRVAHDGGGRVAFDIPESEMPALMRLILYRGRVIRVTIEEETPQEGQAGKKVRKKKAEPDLEWGDDESDDTG